MTTEELRKNLVEYSVLVQMLKDEQHVLQNRIATDATPSEEIDAEFVFEAIERQIENLQDLIYDIGKTVITNFK